MIARIWHGWTAPGQADQYETLLKHEIIPGIQQRGISGFKNIHVLKRQLENETEFTTIMWFDNLESVKQFAGEDYETAYVPEAARKVLNRFDKKVVHHELRWTISQNE
jgi:heme-degrading monooxygenase HmoA